jgi:ribonuclease J
MTVNGLRSELKPSRGIWSQWDSYLKEAEAPSSRDQGGETDAREQSHHHTSGHASIAAPKRLAAAIAPNLLLPFHTFEGDRFSKCFGNVTRRNDGE